MAQYGDGSAAIFAVSAALSSTGCWSTTGAVLAAGVTTAAAAAAAAPVSLAMAAASVAAVTAPALSLGGMLLNSALSLARSRACTTQPTACE
jgi:hypothetical protein